MADADDEEQKKWYEREQDEETKNKLADTNMEVSNLLYYMK